MLDYGQLFLIITRIRCLSFDCMTYLQDRLVSIRIKEAHDDPKSNAQSASAATNGELFQERVRKRSDSVRID